MRVEHKNRRKKEIGKEVQSIFICRHRFNFYSLTELETAWEPRTNWNSTLLRVLAGAVGFCCLNKLVFLF